jgi:flagellar basal body-associated protein FliL
MSELTEKQRKYREYYQRNKAKVCADKRAKYHNKKTTAKAKSASKPAKAASAAAHTVFNQPLKPNRTEVTKDTATLMVSSDKYKTYVDHDKVAVRRRIADLKLAKELGVSVEDLA